MSIGERTTSANPLRGAASGRARLAIARQTLLGVCPHERSDPLLRRGTVLSETYCIERLLAQGGMGAVYLAWDMQLDREVAVKVLLPRHAADPRIAGLFRDEARAMARVHHANVVQVFATGMYNALPFFVMEYVPGLTVAAVVRESRLRARSTGLAAVSRILSQASQGLNAIHACDLFHGDVKPSNMLITSAFHVAISDFGLVGSAKTRGGKTRGESAAAAVPDFLGGTPLYIAPELICGGEVHPEKRHLSDVYSLGASVFEMLTGHGPFDGATVEEILKGHLFATPPKVTDSRPDLPPEIDDIMARALAKDPEQRFQGCIQLAAAVDQVAA